LKKIHGMYSSLFSQSILYTREQLPIKLTDKGATVALQYGVEGFVTARHLNKEDGSVAKVDEKLEFKVLEFSKSAKKIVLSHTRMFEEDKKAADVAEKKATAAATKKATKKLKASLEKTTLGDISDLAALKEEMEKKGDDKSDESKEK
jgi:small subunit ribosomal protein S1